MRVCLKNVEKASFMLRCDPQIMAVCRKDTKHASFRLRCARWGHQVNMKDAVIIGMENLVIPAALLSRDPFYL
jgi:hypothetical protein